MCYQHWGRSVKVHELLRCELTYGLPDTDERSLKDISGVYFRFDVARDLTLKINKYDEWNCTDALDVKAHVNAYLATAQVSEGMTAAVDALSIRHRGIISTKDLNNSTRYP